jgi:hypothetical protein
MNLKEQKSEWFVIHDGKHYGPVSLDDLRDEVKRGRLHPHQDMLWKNGLTSWVPAGTLEKMAASLVMTKAENPQFDTHQAEGSSERSVRISFLLWLSTGLFLLGAIFFLLMVVMPKEHQLRVKLYEGIERVEAIWQKR